MSPGHVVGLAKTSLCGAAARAPCSGVLLKAAGNSVVARRLGRISAGLTLGAGPCRPSGSRHRALPGREWSWVRCSTLLSSRPGGAAFPWLSGGSWARWLRPPSGAGAPWEGWVPRCVPSTVPGAWHAQSCALCSLL